MPRSSVRALDAGPVLSNGRVLRPGGAARKTPSSKGSASAARPWRRAKPLVEIIADRNAGEEMHLRTGQVAKPTFPYLHEDLAPTAPVAASNWLTGSRPRTTRYFAKSYVNRMWSYLLGVGIIEPIDDIRAGNPPDQSCPAGRADRRFPPERFQHPPHAADHLQIARLISSRFRPTLSTATTISITRMPLARRLPAEVLYDTMHRATGS